MASALHRFVSTRSFDHVHLGTSSVVAPVSRCGRGVTRRTLFRSLFFSGTCGVVGRGVEAERGVLTNVERGEVTRGEEVLPPRPPCKGLVVPTVRLLLRVDRSVGGPPGPVATLVVYGAMSQVLGGIFMFFVFLFFFLFIYPQFCTSFFFFFYKFFFSLTELKKKKKCPFTGGRFDRRPWRNGLARITIKISFAMYVDTSRFVPGTQHVAIPISVMCVVICLHTCLPRCAPPPLEKIDVY